jgi:DNA polymerase/3'-5' exonuclease PolX
MIDLKTAIKTFNALKRLLKVKMYLCGSFGRMLFGDEPQKKSKDCDILIVSSRKLPSILPTKLKCIRIGNTFGTVLFNNCTIDLYVVPKESVWFGIIHFLGPKEHNLFLRRRAKSLGYKLNQLCLQYNKKKLYPSVNKLMSMLDHDCDKLLMYHNCFTNTY